jgi:hypothetical protein
MGDSGAFRSEPVESWSIDLNDPAEVLEVLRQASVELVRAESQVEAAEKRAKEAERRLERFAQQSAGTLHEAQSRSEELRARAEAEHLVLSERLAAVEATLDAREQQAAADYRAVEQRAVQAEVLAAMVQERNSRLEQRIQDLEEQSEASDRRAKTAEQRVAWMREALTREPEPDTAAPAKPAPLPRPSLATSGRRVQGAVKGVVASLGQGLKLRLGVAVVSGVALVGLMGAGAHSLIGPGRADAVSRRVESVALPSQPRASLPIASVSKAEPLLASLEPPQPVNIPDEPAPARDATAKGERIIDPAKADGTLEEPPAMPAPTRAAKPAGKPQAEAKRVMPRPAFTRLPQPTNF